MTTVTIVINQGHNLVTVTLFTCQITSFLQLLSIAGSPVKVLTYYILIG